MTADDLHVTPKLQHLYKFLVESQYIQPIRDFKPEYLSSSISRGTSSAAFKSAIRRGSTTSRPTSPS